MPESLFHTRAARPERGGPASQCYMKCKRRDSSRRPASEQEDLATEMVSETGNKVVREQSAAVLTRNASP